MKYLTVVLLLAGCTGKDLREIHVYSDSKNPPYNAAKECKKKCKEIYGTEWIGCDTYTDGLLKNCWCK